MTMENKDVCTQCPNHCPITDLRCPRGRAALGGQSDQMEEHGGHGSHGRHGGPHGRRGPHGHGEEAGRHHGGHPMNLNPDSLEGLMSMCGHHLHHRGRRGGQNGILALLAEKESMDQKELQQLLQIQPGSVSEILMKLERKGFITREKNEEDRRRSVVWLTEKGKEALKEQNSQEEETDMFAALNEEEKSELKRLLKKLLESWGN